MKPKFSIIAEQESEERIAERRLRHLAPPGETFKVVRAAKLTNSTSTPIQYTDEQRARFRSLYIKILAVGMTSLTGGTGK